MTNENTKTSTGISKKIKIVMFCLAALLAVGGLSVLGAQMLKRGNGLASRDASARTGTANLAGKGAGAASANKKTKKTKTKKKNKNSAT